MLEDDYNFFLKDENLHTYSDSISFFKDNTSTYMGVKTIQEGTVADTNKKEIPKKNSPKKDKCQKKTKKTKKKKYSSSSSNSSFSSSSSESSESSESYIDLKEELIIDQNNDEDKLNQENLKESDSVESNNNNLNNNNSNEIRTEFYWDEGGNVIYITGSFCEWKDFFLMEKNEKGIYTKTLMLPPGFYQYKFKVDDNWAYSKKQQKFEDNEGNVNNFIDTTNYFENKILNKKEEKSSKKNNNKEIIKTKEEKQKQIKRESSNNSLGIFNNSNYSTYIPLKGELNIKPLSLPGLYKTHYILNEKKNKKVKERKFSQIEYVDNTNNSIHSNIYVNNDLYVGFHNLYHIHSNHLHSKEIIDSKNVITSIITRYRAKFSTFIYYKGKQEEKINRKHSKSVKVNDGLEKIGKIIKTKNIIYK